MNMIDMLVVGGCFFLAGMMYTNERVRVVNIRPTTIPKLDFARRFSFSLN